MGTRLSVRLGTVLVAGAVGALALAAPVAAASPTPAALPTVVVTGSIDRTSYALGQAVTVTLTVKNTGPGPARLVDVSGVTTGVDWQTNPINTTFPMAVGESKTLVARGHVNQQGYDEGTVFVSYFFNNIDGMESLGQAQFETVAHVPGLTGHVHLRAYDSRNPPGGPGIPGVQFHFLFGPQLHPLDVVTVTTGADGIADSDIPVGDYVLIPPRAEGWGLDCGHFSSSICEHGAESVGISKGSPEFDEDFGMLPCATCHLSPSASPSPSASRSSSASQSSTAHPSAGTGSATPQGQGGGLPVTGGSTGTVAGIGAVSLVAGCVALLVARRRRAGRS